MSAHVDTGLCGTQSSTLLVAFLVFQLVDLLVCFEIASSAGLKFFN